MNRTILLPLISALLFTTALHPGLAAPRTPPPEIVEVLRTLSSSVNGSGRVNDRSAFLDQAGALLDKVDAFCAKPDFDKNRGNYFPAALAYRVICGAGEEVKRSRISKRGKEGLTRLRDRFAENFKRPHPGIVEMLLQVSEDDMEVAVLRKRRLECALAGCRESFKIINNDCARSEKAFDQYFDSYKDAYVFGLVDMLHRAKADESFDYNADHLIPIYVRTHKGDVVLSTTLFDEDVEHDRFELNLCMQMAWNHWNKRYRGTFDYELDLGEAWQVLTAPPEPVGEPAEAPTAESKPASPDLMKP